MEITYIKFDNKKLLVMIILAIFLSWDVDGAASATHTFEDKGFKYKMSNKKVKTLKKCQKEWLCG